MILVTRVFDPNEKFNDEMYDKAMEMLKTVSGRNKANIKDQL